MTSPILSVSGLTTSFRVEGPWRSVVRGATFDIAPKETVALVGESGSGKSVTAHLDHAPDPAWLAAGSKAASGSRARSC